VQEGQSQEREEKQEGKGGRRQKDPVRAKPAEKKCEAVAIKRWPGPGSAAPASLAGPNSAGPWRY
jgi:hypothetical protein